MREGLLRSILVSLLVIASVLFPQKKGVELIEDQLGPNVKIGKQYLVLIAIDDYKNWLPLKNPVKDAKDMRSILESRYYINKVLPLYNENATKGKIIALLKQLQHDLKPEDSVLIYYSGHGYYEKLSKTGYWIPADGGKNVDLQDRWINNTRIKGLIEGIKSRHILLISDSCFSGQLLDLKKGETTPLLNNEYYKKVYNYQSRQVLTSGALEIVPDNSEFALHLRKVLNENKTLILDVQELYLKIREGMSKSIPMLGELTESGHQKGGSFLFFLKENETSNESTFDFYIKTKTQTEKKKERGLESSINERMTEIWMSKEKCMVLSEKNGFIINLDSKIVYFIDHSRKEYIESTLPLDVTKIIPQEYKHFFSMISANVTLNPNGKKKRIGNWMCNGYSAEIKLHFMGMTIDTKSTEWATTEVPFNWPSYKNSLIPIIIAGSLVHSQMPVNQDIIEEFVKIEGYVVASHSYTRVMDYEYIVTSKVQEMSQKIPPRGIYEIPIGYAKVDTFFAEE